MDEKGLCFDVCSKKTLQASNSSSQKNEKKKSKDSVEESNSLTIKSRCYFFKRVTTE